MEKIFNGTPHAINIYGDEAVEFNATKRKYIIKDGAVSIATIPSHGILNANIKTVGPTIEDGIPVFEKEIVSVDKLPSGYEKYVVSALFATAYIREHPDHQEKIYTVADPIYTDDEFPKVVGCRGICSAF